MRDIPYGAGDLAGIFHSRASFHADKHNTQFELTDIYNGNLPERFNSLFHPSLERKHIINMIRLAWDDHAAMAGQEFPLFFPTENDGAAAKDRAEKRERVCYGYNAAGRKGGGIDMKGLMKVLSWWLVGCGEATLLVEPDYKRTTPKFTYRDPRDHFTPVGWDPWASTPLDGTMFAYQRTLGQLKQDYPDMAGTLDAHHGKSIYGGLTTGWKGRFMSLGSGSQDEDARPVWVGEYYSKDYWCFATLEDEHVVLFESDDTDRKHPGVCPVVHMTLYNPDNPRGFFADQIDTQAALSRMFSAKLEFYDKTLYPTIFTSRLAHKDIRTGPNAVNFFADDPNTKPFVHVVQPANSVDADRMMEFSVGLSRMLNRNPASFQGEGQADSAKALVELKSGVSQTIQEGYWPSYFQGLPKAYGLAMRVDRRLWGHDKKMISGRTPEMHLSERNTPISLSYTPNLDLAGWEDECDIEPGILLRGYEGRLELMQLKGAGMVSLDTALEQLDVVRDPQAERRRIRADMLEELDRLQFESQAQAQTLAPTAIADLYELVTKKGMGWFEAKKKLADEGKLLVPPPEPGAMPGAEGPMPPELAALMGGGEGGGRPAPPLELIRGGGGP